MVPSVLAMFRTSKTCTFAAGAQHSESKTLERTLMVVDMVPSVLAMSRASKTCTFAASARHSESKTSGKAPSPKDPALRRTDHCPTTAAPF